MPRKNIPSGSALLGTERGIKWLKQFGEEDLPVAALLAESLELVSNAVFVRSLMDAIVSVAVTTTRKLTPTALFAVREVPKPSVRSARTVTPPPPYFNLTNATLPPAAVASSGGIGSEGEIAHLIRDVCSMAQSGTIPGHRNISRSGALLDHPSIAQMRATRVRRIVVVDDIVGSGTRVSKFVPWFVAHPTLRSWFSTGLVRLYVVAFAATRRATNLLKRRKYISGVSCVRNLERGRAIWGQRLFEQVESLCEKYGRRTAKPGASLGYKNNLSCLVFEHGCPNTAPVILWERGSHWTPLFSKRPTSGFPVWPRPTNGADASRKFLHLVGQQRLSQARVCELADEDALSRFKLLAAVAKGHRRSVQLADLFEVSTQVVELWLAQLVQLGWVSLERRPTKNGLRELATARRRGVAPKPEDDVGDPNAFYYPKQLRRSQRTI